MEIKRGEKMSLNSLRKEYARQDNRALVDVFNRVWLEGVTEGFDLPDAAKESVYVVVKKVLRDLESHTETRG